MKNLFTLLFLSLFSFPVFGGINYEKGCILNNEGEKIACQIDNKYWMNNPDKINYIVDEKLQEGNLDNIASFEIYGFRKYERNTVKIVIPKQAVEDGASFLWEKKTLFLRVLVEGDMSLYVYEGGSSPVYFYKTALDTVPVQLKHRVSESAGKIKNDNSYINQLNVINKNCPSITFNEISRVQYKRNDLTTIFVRMNKCKQVPYVFYQQKKRQLFKAHMEINGGAINSNLRIQYGADKFYNGFYSYKSGSKMALRLGAAIELESIVYCKNYSAVLESYYQKFSDFKALGGPHEFTIKMNGLHFNLGVRRYFHLNSQTSFFVNGFIGLHTVYFNPALRFDYHATYTLREYAASFRTFGDFTIGGGCRINRFGAELRYNIPHGITSNNKVWNSTYSDLQAILSVRLF